MKMKILQLVTERQYRGAQVSASELSQMLAANGHTVFFVGLYSVSENILVAKGAENFDLGGKRGRFSPALLMRLIKLIKKVKPDIIQANGSDTIQYAAIAKFFYPGLNLIYRNISTVSARINRNSIKTKLYRQLFKKVDRVSSVGTEAMKDLSDIFQYPLKKMRVTRRGIPEMNYDHAAARQKIISEFNFSGNDFIMISIGQFSPEKNHAFMIACMEKLNSQYPQVKLLFVGEGEKFEEMKSLINEKNLQRHIIQTGYRKNVQELLAGSDISIFASTIEGLPGVILEAGMQSLPTVAVNVGSIKEAMLNGETGILLEQHNQQEFCSAIESLLHDKKLAQKMGANAKKFALENFSLQSSLAQFESMYEELIKEKKSN